MLHASDWRTLGVSSSRCAAKRRMNDEGRRGGIEHGFRLAVDEYRGGRWWEVVLFALFRCVGRLYGYWEITIPLISYRGLHIWRLWDNSKHFERGDVRGEGTESASGMADFERVLLIDSKYTAYPILPLH